MKTTPVKTLFALGALCCLFLIASVTILPIAAARPQAKAVIDQQMNVKSEQDVPEAQRQMGFCQHYTITDTVDGINVACINVYITR